MESLISIVGLGGAGCKIIDRVAQGISGASAIVAVNTDSRSLAASSATTKIQIGSERLKGLGAGGDVSVGRQIAQNDVEMLRNLFQGKKIVVLVLGLGGGTGTGAAPVLINAARDAGATTLCFATFPFKFEGNQRKIHANLGITELRECADALVLVSNDRLCWFVDEGNLVELFSKCNDVLSAGICSVWKMIARPGYINLDMANIRNVIHGKGGVCTFGYGDGKGENRVEDAVKHLLEGPMLEQGKVVSHARSLLVSIIGGSDLALKEVGDIMNRINETVREDCHVSMGTVIDEDWNDRITVTVIASEQWVERADLLAAQASESEPLAEQYALPGMDSDISGTYQAVGPGVISNRKRRRASAMQTKLSIESSAKGRFKDAEPTILDGENLDIPTFIRRGIVIEK